MSRRPQAAASRAHGSSSLPEDASGEYLLGEPGEIIEIVLQSGRLDGYISRQGEMESDRGTPLTFFFDRTTLRADRLGFTTWQVHGVWFSFEGTIARRSANAEAGRYSLEGELIEHNEARHTQQRGAIRLRLSQEADEN